VLISLIRVIRVLKQKNQIINIEILERISRPRRNCFWGGIYFCVWYEVIEEKSCTKIIGKSNCFGSNFGLCVFSIAGKSALKYTEAHWWSSEWWWLPLFSCAKPLQQSWSSVSSWQSSIFAVSHTEQQYFTILYPIPADKK